MAENQKTDQELADEWAAALEQQADNSNNSYLSSDPDLLLQEAQKVPLQTFSMDALPSGTPQNMDLVMDIPVTISMEVGSAEISIRNLLQLNQGSVVELNRMAGEPLDVLVNGMLIAHGEVVVVNQKFGIRLTDIVSQSERIKRLK